MMLKYDLGAERPGKQFNKAALRIGLVHLIFLKRLWNHLFSDGSLKYVKNYTSTCEHSSCIHTVWVLVVSMAHGWCVNWAWERNSYSLLTYDLFGLVHVTRKELSCLFPHTVCLPTVSWKTMPFLETRAWDENPRMFLDDFIGLFHATSSFLPHSLLVLWTRLMV